jgi:hypothetical protein
VPLRGTPPFLEILIIYKRSGNPKLAILNISYIPPIRRPIPNAIEGTIDVEGNFLI